MHFRTEGTISKTFTTRAMSCKAEKDKEACKAVAVQRCSGEKRELCGEEGRCQYMYRGDEMGWDPPKKRS